MLKRLLTGSGALLLVAACADSPTQPVDTNPDLPTISFRKMGNIAICHYRGNGTYKAISVNANAENAHRAHGDVSPGEAIEGGTLDANCGFIPALEPGPCLQQAIDRHDNVFDPDWDWDAGGPWEVTQDDNNQYEILTRSATTGFLEAPAAVVSFHNGTCGVAPEGQVTYTTSDAFPLSDLQQAKAFLQSLVG